jgi:hypothetical protein
LKVLGTVISVQDDGLQIVSVNDSSISSAGKAGVGMGAVQNATDDLSAQQLDNFTVQIAD